ncbi:MAG: DUF1491 family protein [Alphaproteobacteria bacterium]
MNDDPNEEAARLPSGLIVEAVLKQCDIDFIPYYILQRGDFSSGIIMAKINGLDGRIALRIQQRNFMSGQLEWSDANNSNNNAQETEERIIDSYIERSIKRDPDLWVIEFESRDLQNPFERELM